jgi:hypothetical protein
VVNGGFDFQRVNISPKFDYFYRWTKTGLKVSSIYYNGGFNYPAADQRNSIYANSLHLKGSTDDGVEQLVTGLPKGHFIFSAYVRLVEPDAPGADVYLSVYKGDNEIAGTWASPVQLSGEQKWRMVKVPFRNLFTGDFTVRITKEGDGEAFVDNIGLVPVYADDPFDFEIDTHAVVIRVQDGITKQAIPGCDVIFNNENYLTDTNGQVALKDIISDQYSLLVKKVGFEDYYTDALEIFSDTTVTINLSTHPSEAGFQVLDRSSGDPVFRAKITVNDDQSALTSSKGLATFESPAGAWFRYLVEHDEYFSLTDSVFVIGDTTVVVHLTNRLADFRLIVKDEAGNPVINAEAMIGNWSGKSDNNGYIFLLNQQARQEYPVTVEKTGFRTYTDTIYLEYDTIMNIVLQLETAVVSPGSVHLEVYPIPAVDKLIINHTDEIAEIFILGMDGKARLNREINTGITVLDISGIETGIYYLRFHCKGYHSVRRIVVL